MERGRLTAKPGVGLLSDLLEASLGSGAEARFEVDGQSMLPLVRPGDIVLMARRPGQAPALGDLVAVRGAPGTSVHIHRVVKTSGERLLVRGDNTSVANGEFDLGDLMGVVARVERDGRAVWFGAGRWGWLVAWAVRTGLVWRVNRVFYALRRRMRACLKFAMRATRLREHKGDNGNE